VADSERDPEPASLLEAFSVRRQARRGFGAGILLAALLFVVFVAGPTTDRSPVLYAALGAVLAFSTGLLLTGVLVVVVAVRLARDG